MCLLYSFVNHLVPIPNVSVSLGSKPVIGKSFSMECRVIVAKGVIGNVDIIWTVNGTVKRRSTDTLGNINLQHMLHRDTLNITELQLSDNNTVYYCKAVINAHTHMEGNDSITLTIGKLICVHITNSYNV